ncbi:MAG TPA: TrkA family potassium uptake protein [Tissierellaceae bacterium]|nr:TrkA family potassium uptake protein [Tissierellaceae bacterium]
MKSFAVIGCGRFGSSVAKTLFELGNKVLVVDEDPDTVEKISKYATEAVEANVKNEAELSRLNLNRYDVVIISIGSNMESSILSTLLVKELGAKNIVAQAQSELHGRILIRNGADKVIFPEMDMGVKVAHNLTANNVLEYVQLSPDLSIMEFSILSNWDGKSISELKLRNKYGINVIAVKRQDEVIPSPEPDFILKHYDVLVIIGSEEKIKGLDFKSNG